MPDVRPAVHAGIPPWPPTKVGTGPALSKRRAAERLGLKGAPAIEMMIYRTRKGTARVAFPDPEGYAQDPEVNRRQATPWWRERTIIKYGKDAGLLDEKGNVIKASEE